MGVWNVGKVILFPFAIIFDSITRFRNHLFDIGYKPSFTFDSHIICIGNLAVGGAGKTPMTEYLIRLLKDQIKLSTLSRGYGRQTKGFYLASQKDSAATIGDEPFQFFLKFKNQIQVAVGEDRAFAIPNILHQCPETKVILMDDAFQHRTVRPQLSILVSDFNNPFFNDFLMPTGKLREARTGAKRADIVVITKCPSKMEASKAQIIRKKIKKYAAEKPVFFSSIRYGSPVSFGKEELISSNVVLVSGIANSKPLVSFVSNNFNLLRHFEYPDHHHYTMSDFQKIAAFCKQYEGKISIITTEKDMTKLIAEKFNNYMSASSWFYLPIEAYFLEDGEKFDQLITNSISSK